MGTKIQGWKWKLRDMESAEKAEYCKPLTAKCWYFTHVIRYALYLIRFQSVPHRRAMSMYISGLKLAADQGECQPSYA